MIVVSGDDVVRALRRLGFTETSQRGSHPKMTHPDGRVAIVPMHRTIKPGTLSSVLRQAKITQANLAANR